MRIGQPDNVEAERAGDCKGDRRAQPASGKCDDGGERRDRGALLLGPRERAEHQKGGHGDCNESDGDDDEQ
jgi:hypothetical protein